MLLKLSEQAREVRLQLYLALIVSTVGLIAAFTLYSLDRHSLLYFGDAASHLFGARKLVDWVNPGLQQLGTVWLPLPHLLLLPFTLINPLFSTGFAGLVVSLPCLVITSLLIYKMVRIHLDSSQSYIAFVVALLYATNPSILYMGITGMTESPFMLFFVASAYFIQKWYKNPENLRTIGVASVFIALSTLCRYEGWFFPFFLLGIVGIVYLRRKPLKLTQFGTAILLAFVSFSGVIFWLAWNAYAFGNPLEFANQPYYSAAAQAQSREFREGLFLQPLNDLVIYSTTGVFIYGPVILAAAGLGFYFSVKSANYRRQRIVYAFLALAPIFTLISLFIGIGEMSFWFNSRFLILLAPLLALLISVYLVKLPKRIQLNRKFVVGVIAALFVYPLITPVFGVATYLDAKGGFFYEQNPFAVQTGEALGSLYDGGTIMVITGSAQEQRMIVPSGITLKNFDEILVYSTYKKSFQEPWLYDKFIVIGLEPDQDASIPSKYWQDRQSLLNQHYDQVYENQYYRILKLKS